jgi:2-methylisocitrate lyase-like PEP mutase family enzyme
MNKTRKLRELFNSNKLIRVMGAHNALGAKLVEKSGWLEIHSFEDYKLACTIIK